MNKEQEEQQRAYIPPDYSEAEKLCPKEDDDDIEDVDLDEEDDDDDLDDDDDYIDEEEEEDDPAEEENKLSSGNTSTPAPSPTTSKPSFGTPFTNQQNTQQRNMSTPNWPSTGQGSGFGGYGGSPQPQTSQPWGSTQRTTPWTPGGSTPGWGQQGTGGWATPSVAGGNKPILDRSKNIVFCDVLDCLVVSPEAGQRLGVIPRGIYDISLRLDVWAALRRLCPLERIYAMIPKSLILNGSGEGSWMALLNYIACALSEFLKIPTSSCQILTQNFIVQPKADMIASVLGNIDREEAVYIGTQSGFIGQSRVDIDAADELGIDYIDLGQFMTYYQ